MNNVTVNEVQEQHNGSGNEAAVQYLTFKLDGEVFSTEISRVREVLEYTDITRVPRTPDYMKGVINLRGSVVPVIDLRLQFGMSEGERTVDTCIIIIEVDIDEKTTVLGALADLVQEVVDIRPEQLEPAPTLGTRIKTEFIQNMGKVDEGFIIILDMNRIFTNDQLVDVQKSGQQLSIEEDNIQDVA